MAETDFTAVEIERKYLEDKLNVLIRNIGNIPIANTRIMPYGWRKAANGRTVWRIVEEVISQGLESQANDLGFDSVHPADSEVGVYDFRFCYDGNKESYVNIKSSVKGGRSNKDDISKAAGLIDFYKKNPNAKTRDLLQMRVMQSARSTQNPPFLTSQRKKSAKNSTKSILPLTARREFGE